MDPQLVSILNLVAQFGALVGIGAAVALIVNIGKFFNIIKDGQATSYAAALNLIAMILLIGFKIYKPDLDIAYVDATIAMFVTIGSTLFGLVTEMLSSKLTNYAVRGAAFIGTSYTLDTPRISKS